MPNSDADPHAELLALGVEALTAGRSVVVTGPWGSGRTHLAARLGSAGGTPIAVLDDAHLLAAVPAELTAPHVLTVPRGERLAPALRRTVSVRDALVLELEPWSVGAVATYVASRSGSTPDPETAERLHRWSGGLPALLVGMPAGDDPLAVGPGLRARVTGLLDDLGREQRQALTSVIASGPVPVTLADATLNGRAVDALLARGLLVERDEGEVADLQPVAEVLWRSATEWVSPRRRREVCRTLATRTGPDDLARLSLHQRLQVARWAVYADGVPDAVALVRQGVRPAMLLGDPALAVSLGSRVLAGEPDDAATRDLVVIAYEALGDHARATATGAPADPVGATARARHATNVYLATLDPGSAHQVAPAVAAAEDNGEAAALLGWMQLLMGDLDDACATASPVLEDPSSSVQARVWAGLDVAVADVLRGGGPECLDLLDLSRRIAVAQPAGLTPYSEFQVATSRCVAMVRLGRGSEALPAAEAGLAGTSDPQLQAAWHGVAGLAARETGEFERGSRHFAAIGDILSGDPFGLGTWAASESAVCAFMRGAPPPAAPAETNPIGLTEAVLARNAAWCLAPADRRAAADLALDAAETARSRGQSTNEVLALVDAARWGRASTAATAIGAILLVDNPLILAGGAVISAWLRQRPVELLGAARSAADVGWWVVREELLVLARSRLVAGAQPTAAARLELMLRPHRWPTPLLLADDTPAFLTPREVELGRLAAAGVPSAAIAERLGVSQRTVDNLLGRVYAKCGVTGRRMLSDAVPQTAQP